MEKILFWFRRDLRVTDNNGFYHALNHGQVIPCFILDSNILSQLSPDDARVTFIWQSILELKAKFNNYNSDLLIYYGDPSEIIPKISREFKVKAVYTNEDYEPYAISRDNKIKQTLLKDEIVFQLFQDHVIFAKDEILNKNGKPYTIFTPYKNTWLNLLEQLPNKLQSYTSEDLLNNLYKIPITPAGNLSQYKFSGFSQLNGGESAAQKRLENFISNISEYNLFRDFPEIERTSHLGTDLRFGTISIRQLVRFAKSQKGEGGKIWLNELIWREFFSQILYNFPYVVDKPFNLKYSNLKYTFNPKWYQAWCEGNTGYPIIDAGIRELNQTGFMHNRVRMIVASFLCKDLLINWQMGEGYFAQKLLDYELASNNGNWQWAASTGCDAMPYFRVFNPITQAKKFDKDAIYIKRFVPELRNVSSSIIHDLDKLRIAITQHQVNYAMPIVEHSTQSRLAKELFASI